MQNLLKPLNKTIIPATIMSMVRHLKMDNISAIAEKNDSRSSNIQFPFLEG